MEEGKNKVKVNLLQFIDNTFILYVSQTLKIYWLYKLSLDVLNCLQDLGLISIKVKLEPWLWTQMIYKGSQMS